MNEKTQWIPATKKNYLIKKDETDLIEVADIVVITQYSTGRDYKAFGSCSLSNGCTKTSERDPMDMEQYHTRRTETEKHKNPQRWEEGECNWIGSFRLVEKERNSLDLMSRCVVLYWVALRINCFFFVKVKGSVHLI